MKPLAKLLDIMKTSFTESEVLHHNEIQANKLVSVLMVDSALILAVCWVLMETGLFPINAQYYSQVAFWCGLGLVIPAGISSLYKHDRWWMKFLLLFALILSYAGIDMMFSHKAAALMVIPAVVSSRYFSRRVTFVTSLITAAVFAVSAALSTQYGWIDMNVLSLPKGTDVVSTGKFISDGIKNYGLDYSKLLHNTMVYSYLPRLFVFILIATVSMNIARRGREMVHEQAKVTEKTARIDSELALARDIQAGMLPKEFPSSPERNGFDIYAIMQPAKEVGGDFYDFFMLDDRYLAVIIADVSGKGVPSALFMVTARTLMKNTLQLHRDPAEVLNETNLRLCEGNDQGFFVTGWIGILDITNGHMVYANAGHTSPAVCRNGEFGYLKCAPGFILGGMETTRYNSAETDLCPGDALYLYTDGVDEAENAAHELYGNERLLNVLNQNAREDMKQLCEAVKESVEEYAKEVDQFDDITMLALRFLGKETGAPETA